MNLEKISKKNIEDAAKSIDINGVPKEWVYSQHYAVVAGEEYRLKQLLKLAYKISTGEDLHYRFSENSIEWIKTLDFEVTFYEDGYNFFTKKELAIYSSLVGEKYRKNVDEHLLYPRLIYPILEKVNYWGRKMAEEHGYQFARDGRWLTAYSPKIKPYIWPKLYKGENNDIFFNVEVNGDVGFIGFKLDGYFETTKELPKYKLKILADYKNKHEIEWIKISFEQIEEHSWESLFKRSREYIIKHDQHYDDLKNLLSVNSKIARVVWNENGWVTPSGRQGKSEDSSSFEHNNGFGHEEWLLDTSRVIDGYKYGFLEPINKHVNTYAGQKYDFTLYTINSLTNKRYWLGTLKRVVVLHEDESKKVLEDYKKKGWYSDMKDDLFNLGLNGKQLDDWVEGGANKLFNVKIDVNEIYKLPPALLPIESNDEIPNPRYILCDALPDTTSTINERSKTGFSFESGNQSTGLAKKSSRSFNDRKVEYDLHHNILQESFLEFMIKKYGSDNVRKECSAWGGTRVDLVRKNGDEYIFYEIKTYNNLLTSLRVAFGQLMEYCFYPNDTNASQLVLVSEVPPDEKFIKYLKKINSVMQIPIEYIQFDCTEKKIIQTLEY